MKVLESLKIGNFSVYQDTVLYRFTSDSVLLARLARAKRGDVVADFCAGSGIVGLHFYAEHADMVRSVTLFEPNEALAEMSAESIAHNGLTALFSVEKMRLQDIPNAFAERYSLILCNPPYERRGSGFVSADPEKAPCRGELTLTLEELAAASSKCLKFGGRLAVVYRADRICALRGQNLEPKVLRFLAGKAGAKPYAVLLSATKGARAGLEVLPTLENSTKRSTP